MTHPLDPSTDGSYELGDALTVTQKQLADANDHAARAIAQSVHAQRTIDALRIRCRDLEQALHALEVPAEAGHAPG